MRTTPNVILIEFNELCPGLMERFIASGQLPNFRRLYEESEIYVTDAEAEGEDLNPWVQWVTVHSGLSVQEHNVHHLSEGHRLPIKAVWDYLSDAGLRSWVCGSMNPRCDLPLKGYLLPDPWSTGVRPQPSGEFDAYFDFIRSAVQEHSSDSTSGKSSSSRFLKYMLSHGISFETLIHAASQLAGERLSNVRWKRAAIMDQIQWDLFRYYFRKSPPEFATFFLNSTAHFQHSYWRHMEPERFASRPTERDLRTYRGAIAYGYKNMDSIIGKFLKLAGPRTTLVFCTGLSQQPYLDYEEEGGRHYYRVVRKELLSEKLGVTESFAYEPVMAEQFFLRFVSEQEAESAALHLNRLRLNEAGPFKNGNPQLFNVERDGASLLCQCRCTGVVSREAIILGEGISQPLPFQDVFYQLDTIKSGRHHPDGMLWVRNAARAHRVHAGKVSLRSIAPTILQMFGLPIPPHMTSPSLFVDYETATGGTVAGGGVAKASTHS